MALLPRSNSDFHEKAFWENFFLERGQEAFEWYGEFSDIVEHVLRSIRPASRVLVIGCGNSNFSASLYDRGFHQITNLDFSPLVIDEMRSKNSEKRPDMEWEVGDMTDMRDLYMDGSFDVVFDKGALDALVSDSSAATLAKGRQMFSEIDRVLSSTGKYVCISLSQSFILSSIIDFFSINASSSWKISVEPVFCSNPSPFMPFYWEITRQPSAVPTIAVWLDAVGTRLETPALLSVHQVLDRVRLYNYVMLTLTSFRRSPWCKNFIRSNTS